VNGFSWNVRVKGPYFESDVAVKETKILKSMRKEERSPSGVGVGVLEEEEHGVMGPIDVGREHGEKQDHGKEHQRSGRGPTVSKRRCLLTEAAVQYIG
jgi:hypothetical protein